MFKLAFVVCAMMSLSACASLGLYQGGSNASAYESFDAAPMESAVLMPLHRRSFTPPLQRQPELRAIAVTAIDRLRRRSLRRKRGR